eukprot:COSAG02_NODE_1792_length_10916_cov_169.572789_4_plen_85_part_00
MCSQSEQVSPCLHCSGCLGAAIDRVRALHRSFMSGLRPDVTGIFNFANHIREPGQPPIVTTPQQFRDWGYTTLGRTRLLNNVVK